MSSDEGGRREATLTLRRYFRQMGFERIGRSLYYGLTMVMSMVRGFFLGSNLNIAFPMTLPSYWKVKCPCRSADDPVGHVLVFYPVGLISNGLPSSLHCGSHHRASRRYKQPTDANR